MACVYVYVIVLTFLGPEALGRDFRVEADKDMAAATDADAMRAVHGGPASSTDSHDAEKGGHVETQIGSEKNTFE